MNFQSLKKLDLSNLTIVNSQNFKGYFSNQLNKDNLEEVILPEMTVTDLEECFKDCKNLKKVDLSTIKTSEPISLKCCFFGCENLEEIILPEMTITSLERCFEKCKNLKKADLSRIKTAEPICLSCCFFGCENLEEVILPDNLKTDSFNGTFNCCRKIKNIDLKNTQISPYILDKNYKFYNFIGAFNNCNSLENVDLSRIIFTDKELKQYSILSMFAECNNLDTVDMRKFEFNDTSAITGAFLKSKIKTILLNNFPNKNESCFFLNSNIKNLQLTNTKFEEFKKTETYKENYNNIENLLIDGKKVDDNERKKANEEIEEEKRKVEEKRLKEEAERLKNEQIKSNTCLNCCANCCCCKRNV